MNPLWVILIIAVALIYIVSPYDIIPDLMPILGRIDDLALTALLIYYLKTGRVPGFVSRLAGWIFGTGRKGAAGGKERARTSGTGGFGGGSAGKDPYSVLGLSPGASKKEIHEAYRKLAHQYHPDKVSHLGEEFRELARQKFIEIQEAYEKLTGKSP